MCAHVFFRNKKKIIQKKKVYTGTTTCACNGSFESFSTHSFESAFFTFFFLFFLKKEESEKSFRLTIYVM